MFEEGQSERSMIINNMTLVPCDELPLDEFGKQDSIFDMEDEYDDFDKRIYKKEDYLCPTAAINMTV